MRTSPGGSCASEPCEASAVRRALYIGDELYTLSDDEARATSLASYVTTWGEPLHAREVLAREGGCTLGDGGPALNWTRVAAAAPGLYCGSSGCKGDRGLREHRCAGDGEYRSYEALLNGASTPCGNLSCADGDVGAIEYNGCALWF